MMSSTFNKSETYIEELIVNTINKALKSSKDMFGNNEWMSLKEAAKYANVSNNTLMKFRVMGLKISEIDGVKRFSKKEIDRFLEQHSF